MTYTLASACSGFGGLDLAVEAVFGPARHLWHAEYDPGDPGKNPKNWDPLWKAPILAAHWPGVPNLGDLSSVDWASVERPDILTAGFPCTDISTAGRQAGMALDRWRIPPGTPEMPCGCLPINHKVWCEAVSPLGYAPADQVPDGFSLDEAQEWQRGAIDALNQRDREEHPEWLVKGTRSGVWSHVAAAIAALRPPLVLIENVRALLSTHAQRNTDGTVRSLEPASAVLGDGADGPALRALGAVLGDLADLGFDAQWATVPASVVGACHRRDRVFVVAWPADSEGVGHWHRRTESFAGIPPAAVAGRVGASCLSLLPTPMARDGDGRGEGSPGYWLTQSGREAGQGAPLGAVVNLLPTPRATDGTNGGPNQRGSSGDLMLPSAAMELLPTPVSTDAKGARNATANRSAPKATTATDGWTLSDVAHADRWGRYAPAIRRWEQVTGRPAPEPTEPGSKGQPRLSARFVEWMQGLPDGWVTDHVGRNKALHALGDGVVWQQGAYALRLLLASAVRGVAV